MLSTVACQHLQKNLFSSAKRTTGVCAKLLSGPTFSSSSSSSSDHSNSSPAKQSNRPLRMVPHTRSREHWKVLVSKMHKSQMDNDATSSFSADVPQLSLPSSNVRRTGTNSENVIYFASLDCYGFGHSVRTTAVEDSSQKAFDLRDRVISTLSCKSQSSVSLAILWISFLVCSLTIVRCFIFTL